MPQSKIRKLAYAALSEAINTERQAAIGREVTDKYYTKRWCRIYPDTSEYIISALIKMYKLGAKLPAELPIERKGKY